ncbi:putative oxygen-independent coproporphyrinogen III oxidase [Aedoeadaptatus nemausensis]|uniref:Heme chaperone HemW n=1 Tax=Aedoeadaptatus nemausensis TaxID=2582829 RepID=A0A6V6XYP6_9FIRM|nr:radical SAM family heme chaperone HemW [Peptoniphilus nemausensis]CAC9922715.1 putative oxygen-independent coproporphyrinogen III oxidase [Peptoniphilus nemausensis]
MNRSLAIYIHVPFCEKKCGYCDFYSFLPKSEEVMDDYVDNLLREWELYEGELRGQEISSLFLGGGTPSMLGTERLLRILTRVAPYVEKSGEITLECNPESVVALNIEKLMAAGVNRFSMGIQSGSDRLLTIMGRIHNVDEGIKAFRHLREGGAKNINLDFISSVPTESDEDIEKSISLINQLNPEHVSVYSLILEEGTPFFTRYGHMPENDTEDRRHVHRYEKMLGAMGYEQYELSNFSKPGYKCRHNLHYWELGRYIGLGPTASGFLRHTRHTNMASLGEYISSIEEGKKPVAYSEELSPLDRDNEFMMLGIRLNEGINLNEKLPSGIPFKDRYGIGIERNVESGLLKICKHHIVLTERGRDLSNQVEVDLFQLEEE